MTESGARETFAPTALMTQSGGPKCLFSAFIRERKLAVEYSSRLTLKIGIHQSAQLRSKGPLQPHPRKTNPRRGGCLSQLAAEQKRPERALVQDQNTSTSAARPFIFRTRASAIAQARFRSREIWRLGLEIIAPLL